MTEYYSNIISAALNVFLPGIGQLLQSRFITAAAFLFGTIWLYMFFPPFGVLAHLLSIIDALIWNVQFFKFGRIFIRWRRA